MAATTNGHHVPSSNEAVVVTLDELRAGTVAFSTLETAFGPDSLGIIIVKDLPANFAQLRRSLLSYSSYLANLPAPELLKLEHEASKWSFGWSHGKEKLKDGRHDTMKGSYYVNSNPSYDDPKVLADLQSRFPDFLSSTTPNVWPSPSVLPGFKSAFLELCALITDTAVLVARACDQYAVAKIPDYKAGYLEHVVRTSVSTKARLLHYFPLDAAAAQAAVAARKEGNKQNDDDWCGTHLDLDCLTGLTSEMFVDEALHSPHVNPTDGSGSLEPLPELDACPDPDAGLYIHSRAGTVTHVAIPRDALAFQTGQALEKITKGKLKAVPHFVRGAVVPDPSKRVARNTLAVFTQPNLWEELEPGLNFGGFMEDVIRNTH